MKRKGKGDKIRITLDLTPQFYERLQQLEGKVESGSKASLIRQALQVYEFFVDKALDGYGVSLCKGDQHEQVHMLGLIPTNQAVRKSG